MEATIEIVDHATGKVRPYSDLPLPGVGGGAPDFEHEAVWKLRISADEELRAEIRTWTGSGNDRWAMLLECIVDDGTLQDIDPARIAALTEAPMLGQYAVIEDDGGYRVDGKTWAYNEYAIYDPVEELERDGSVEFTFAGAYDDTLFPEMDSPEWHALTEANYVGSAGPRR